jgi:hypothetical protein
MKDQPEDVQEGIADDVSDEAIQECIEFEMHESERQDRLWLRSCTIFIESLSKVNKVELENGTLIAINEAVRAACDRATRIFHCDSRSIEDD